jgi:MurNAc alpha-1-phosphate uridylyltransferase
MMDEGRLHGMMHPGGWADVGHPGGIAEAERMVGHGVAL